MFKLPALPTPRADVHELADFAEILALTNGQTSAREIVAYLGRLDDNSDNVGCDDDDDENADELDEVMNEIERRQAACAGGYPFRLEMEGTVLRYDTSICEQEPIRAVAYLYLLLCTRLNMTENRTHNGIDGSLLMEELASNVLRTYLGGDKAQAIAFGTSQAGNFKNRVDELCEYLGEGIGFRSVDAGTTKAKDGKLDTVAWIPFADDLPGKLILFGQCKTGTNWQEDVSQLQPIDFCKKWMKEMPVVDPVRAFCVAEAVDRSHWNSTAISAGILFDRCRLVEFADEVDADIASRLSNWAEAALLTVELAK